MAHACCLGKLATNYFHQTSDGSFSFSFSPDHKAVVLSVLQRDLHKAKLLIASLQGAHLDNASISFFHGKKREILETAAKKDFCLRLISPVEFVKQKKIL